MDDLIKTICKKHTVAEKVLKRLIEFEKAKVHLERRRGAKEEIRSIIQQHWPEPQDPIQLE